jgi:hypothetical protein
MKDFISLANMAKNNPNNRTVDVCIAEAIDLIAYDDFGVRKSIQLSGLERVVEMADCHQNIWSSRLPRYTSSYDAIMSLVVPGSTVRIEHGTYDNGRGWGYVHMVTPVGEMTGEAEAESELSALLAAMLFARACKPDFTRLEQEDAVIVGATA